MTIDEQNITTYHAICAVVLRELHPGRQVYRFNPDQWKAIPAQWKAAGLAQDEVSATP
ncbi:hypothetical protein [Burkholderia vietnamiensis]|uniref:hypothetical protein n=1 Tax=Burkholderia vietnamiensis TaxID=60552 RepID=UPI001D13DC8D|nr:hypothetical protein [Burkholderia vietnamiensis]UEC01946.1 hypothetical protein LK462_07960 [Burkholderia vietnamiensis]